MKLVILAAGKGTRFLPLTQILPKALIPLKDRTLIDWVLDPFLPHVNEIIFIVNGETGHLLEAHINKQQHSFSSAFIVQNAATKGTFQALVAAKEALAGSETFLVCNCDDLFVESEIKKVIDANVAGIGVSKGMMPWYYLGIDITEDGRINGFRRHEKTDEKVTDLFSNGLHVLDARVFNFEPVLTRDGEAGLPQTLFTHLDEYPLQGFICKEWQAVNGPDDMQNAQRFIENLGR